MRLVDEAGGQLGVMPTREALGMATEQGLDLVEVAPAADPPVCRLMDYGKHRYEATRKEREARKVQKTRVTNQLREVRFRTRIGDHDRNAKTRLVHRLLNQGSKVKVSVLFRGREITHPDLGMTVLRSVAEDLAENALMEKPPGFEGRALTMILSPKPIKVVKTKAEEEPGDSPEPAKAEAGAGDSPKAPRAEKVAKAVKAEAETSDPPKAVKVAKTVKAEAETSDPPKAVKVAKAVKAEAETSDPPKAVKVAKTVKAEAETSDSPKAVKVAEAVKAEEEPSGAKA